MTRRKTFKKKGVWTCAGCGELFADYLTYYNHAWTCEQYHNWILNRTINPVT